MLVLCSAFVGLALMVALLPVPGYLTTLLRHAQVEKMKKVWRRYPTNHHLLIPYRRINGPSWSQKVRTGLAVNSVLTSDDYHKAMNVLRTIKLFGWEGKFEEKIAQRRDEELLWVWKGKVSNSVWYSSFQSAHTLSVLLLSSCSTLSLCW